MDVKTTRFGALEIPDEKIVRFPQGIPGFPGLSRWCLLHHDNLTAVNWLQSCEDADVALLLADPENLFSDYDVRVDARDLAPIGVMPPVGIPSAPPIVLRVVVSADSDGKGLTANLAAPVLINLDTQLAMQMPLRNGEYPLRRPIPLPAGRGTRAGDQTEASDEESASNPR